MKHEQVRVVVLGAGLAGLSTALQLKESGFDVILLEAESRPGGRVETVKLPDGAFVELGAEWIGKAHERVLVLCERFGLTLNTYQHDLKLYHKKILHDSLPETVKLANSLIESTSKRIPDMPEEERIALDKMSFTQFLAEKGIDEVGISYVDLLGATDYGENLSRISALSALSAYYFKCNHEETTAYSIKGGNNLLVNALAEEIGQDSILCQHKVKAVFQDDENVTVQCQDGELYFADYVVCTLPLFAVSQIEWLPSLSDEKLPVIQRLPYGRVTKTCVLLKNPLPESFPHQIISDTALHYIYRAPGISESVVMSYAGGESAKRVSNLSPKDIEGQLSEIADHPVEVRDTIQRSWWNPITHEGAYSLYASGFEKEILGILRKPHYSIFFAGEHTADLHGFMEGALESGERAAYAIIKRHERLTNKSDI